MGELTFSLDEMTGIQALERLMPDIPMKPGRCVKQEFEYIRHGTQTLIASFNVANCAQSPLPQWEIHELSLTLRLTCVI
jgi:hypothetical protein